MANPVHPALFQAQGDEEPASPLPEKLVFCVEASQSDQRSTRLEKMMKKIALATAISLAASTAFAGGVAEPVMEEEVVAAATSSSAGGILVPLLLLLIVAAIATSSEPVT